jgi:hypothetical protein
MLRCRLGRRTISNDSPTGAKTRCLIFEDRGANVGANCDETVLIVAFRGSVGRVCYPRSSNWQQNFDFHLSSMSDLLVPDLPAEDAENAKAKAHRGFQTVSPAVVLYRLAGLCA